MRASPHRSGGLKHATTMRFQPHLPRPVGATAPAREARSATVGRARWRLGTRLILCAAAAWLTFTAARPLLSGRVWWWVLPDLLPPAMFVLVPVVLLAGVPMLRLARIRLPRSATWLVTAIAAAALVAGFAQAGLNLGAMHDPGTPPHGALRVMVWDTLVWDQGDDTGHFYRYLTAQHADLYVLQEYMGTRRGDPWPIDEAARLHRAFPGYHVAVAGELLTLSRFPITVQRALRAPLPPPDSAWASYWDIRVLRTDLKIGDRTLSIYNVHLPDLFSIGPSPFSPAFYHVVRELYTRREAELKVLHADLDRNPNPVLVGGDLNVMPGTGDLHWLAGLTDAAHASGSLYPVSFWVGLLQAWRVDWTMTSPDVRVFSCVLTDPHGLSTHRAQDVTIFLNQRHARHASQS